MTYAAKIIADSYFEGSRLTTFVITLPRFEIAALNTYREWARNSASSRAIPTAKIIEAVEQNPFIPLKWERNQKGMQAGDELSPQEAELARREWLAGRNEMVTRVKKLHAMGLYKGTANRLLEPWMWTTVIITSTSYENFFGQRCHPDAQAEIRKVAEMMRDAYEANGKLVTSARVVEYGGGQIPYSVWKGEVKSIGHIPGADALPRILQKGDWHLPFVTDEEREDWIGDPIDLAKVSAARCARVSYTKHEKPSDVAADLELAQSLTTRGHWSPLEHQAEAQHPHHGEGGNLGYPWSQHRKMYPGENGRKRP